MERLNSKWIATVASIWIQCSIGGTYTFGIYSSTLKSTQNYDQSTLERVAVFKDIGGCTGVLSGLLYSFVTLDRHRRRCFCGPWVVLLTGAILSFVGYLFMWASVVGLIHRPPVALMCLFMFTVAHSMTFSIPADNVTGVRNFPAHVGTIVGLMEGYLGLSGAIIIRVYDALFKGNPSNYLLFLAVYPTSVSLLLMYFVRIHDTNSEDDKKHLNAFSVAALTMVAHLMILIILESIFTLGTWERIVTFIFLLLLLASPLGIAFRAQREDSKRLILSQTVSTEGNSTVHINPEPIESMENHDQLPSDDARQVKTTVDENIIRIEENMNLLQAICTGNFWLLFIAMACDWDREQGMCQTYFCKEKAARGHCSLPSLKQHYLLVTYVASEISGVGHLGTIVNTFAIASPIGSYIFSVRIVGYLYDKAAAASGEKNHVLALIASCYLLVIGYIYDKACVVGDEDNFCPGSHFFILSFLIMVFLALCGSLRCPAVVLLDKEDMQIEKISQEYIIERRNEVVHLLVAVHCNDMWTGHLICVGYIPAKKRIGEAIVRCHHSSSITCWLHSNCFSTISIASPIGSSGIYGSLVAFLLFFWIRRFYDNVVLIRLRLSYKI
ncbi:hypothetical protein QYF36_015147 [Acer negundo]|nr:hypothetical protein QYF36_015147 [Acer negundo]